MYMLWFLRHSGSVMQKSCLQKLVKSYWCMTVQVWCIMAAS